MGASRYVGRIGGLAVALGAGAAMFSGAGVAWADRADSGSDDTTVTRSRSVLPAAARGGAATAVPQAVARVARKHPVPAPRAVAAGATKVSKQVSKQASKPASEQTAQQASKTLTVDPVVSFSDGVFYGQLNAKTSRGVDMTYTPVGGKAGGSNGGKLTLGTNVQAPINAQGFTLLPYRTWDKVGVGKGTEDWKVRVGEITRFDAAIAKIPLVGMVAAHVISLLQQTPLVGTLLAPLIGSSVLATVTADIAGLAAGTTPLAYTYKVSSFDGTLISTNFFPAVGLKSGETAPTILNGPGLAQPGETDPYATCRDCANEPEKTAVGSIRVAGYNAVTWDPRGEFDSGGIFQLDNPFYEGRDVGALVSWAASDTPAKLDAPGDPLIGMIGGSLGGGIQLAYASTDPRIEAITPDISWNSLNQSLYPSEIFKTAFGNLLALALVATKARVNSQLYVGIATGDLFGRLGASSQAVLADSGPAGLLSKLTVPTLLTQGTVDVLFPLEQSMENAQGILGNGTTAKVIWYCGGHGFCADPIGPDQTATIRKATLDWLNQYVAGTGSAADAIPRFQWFDQLGNHYTATRLPYETGFNDRAPLTVNSAGGKLGIVPLIGGSGPGAGPLPVNLTGAGPARNAIDVPLAVPVGTQVVGAPTLSFTYKGFGNSRAVFAQIVDNSTNLVLGQIVTPVPVTLDGKEHQVSIPLNDIVYTYGGAKPGSLTLQVTSSAIAYENASVGFINISDLTVSLPNRTAG